MSFAYSSPCSSPISSPSLRKSYTVKFKSDVLKPFDYYGNVSTASAFGISPCLISKWNKLRGSLFGKKFDYNILNVDGKVYTCL